MPGAYAAISGGLVDLLTVLHRHNYFIKIQEAVMNHIGRRPSNSNHNHLLVLLRFRKVFGNLVTPQPMG